MRKFQLATLIAGACYALGGQSPASAAGNCSSSYTINLTVQLSPELTNSDSNVLVELRQGSVGNSKVVNTKHFIGLNGTVAFADMCAGSYFIDIGNGSKVAVGPVHSFGPNQHIHTTVRVSYSQGNVGTMSRGAL